MSMITLSVILSFAASGKAPAAPKVPLSPSTAGTISVLKTGASPDGRTDCLPAFQKACDSLRACGGTVFVPPGLYLLTKSLTVPPGVTLQGSWQGPHHGDWRHGSTLLITAGHGTEKGPAAIELEQSSCIRGFTIIYPKQRVENVVPYPWTIHGKGMHVTIENITLVNSYNGIALGPEYNELHLIRNVFGCVLRRGIFIDRCTDIGRIENVHFNPHYWVRAEFPQSPGVTSVDLPSGRRERRSPQWFMTRHLEAFIFGRTDWEYVLNTFVFGAKVGYLFKATPNGAPNGNFLGIGADWCTTCLKIENTQSMGILVTNGEFVGNRECRNAIEITGGVLQLCNSNFWGFQQTNVKLSGTRSLASLNQCFFRDWGKLLFSSAACVEAQGGILTIQGSSFMRERLHIRLGKDVRSAVIFGNTFSGKPRIESEAEGQVKIDLNVSPAELRKKAKKPADK